MGFVLFSRGLVFAVRNPLSLSIFAQERKGIRVRPDVVLEAAKAEEALAVT